MHADAPRRDHRTRGLGLALGTMTWSRDTDAEEAGEQLDLFLDAGGTLIDTAASYADGGAEALLGSLLGGSVARATCRSSPRRASGARRRAASSTRRATRCSTPSTPPCERLGTDHVDLFLVHVFDPQTPLDETLHALEIAVNSGAASVHGRL